MTVEQLLTNDLARDIAKASLQRFSRARVATIISKRFGCSVTAAAGAIWYW